jgi:chorismate mutase/prephenate dehydratase
MANQELSELRARIDALDKQLVELLNARAMVSREIGARKAAGGAAVLAPAREAEVIANAQAGNQGPLTAAMIAEVYRAILATSRALQRPLRVAFLGPAATFTHEAAQLKFGGSVQYIPARSIGDVFLVAAKSEADFGVVPVENSTEGVVNHTLDMFMASELKICAEIRLPIAQYLMARQPLDSIRRVYSHPQAVAQSRGWLTEHLPGVEIVEVASTARAAEIAAGEEGAAAVAPHLAAQVYGLEVIASHIEDLANNITRFLVIGQEMSAPSGHDKTALMFCLQDRVGALHDVLAIFKSRKINLSMIESRPSRTQLWDWVFFVEFAGHPQDANVRQVLDDLRPQCSSLKVLGAWPSES